MSNAQPTRELTPVQPSQVDETLDHDPMEIQRLLAWYFHGEDPPRASGGERGLRDAA
jgi:hypothetical protein